MKMDATLADEDEEEVVAPLRERLAKRMEQICDSKTLPMNEKEDIPMKPEMKRGLPIVESSAEPLKKKIKQDRHLDKEKAQRSPSPQSELKSRSGVLPSVENVCDSSIHQNHSQGHLKLSKKGSPCGIGKMAVTSSGEMRDVQSTQESIVVEKSNDGLKSKNGMQSSHKGPLVSVVNDSTKDGSRSVDNNLLDEKLSKEPKLKNGTKPNAPKNEGREQNANLQKNSTFGVGKFYVKSSDTKHGGVGKNYSGQRGKEGQNSDSSSKANSWEGTSSKGKQLVTKNGKIKSKRKGTFDGDNHSPRNERGTDEAGIKIERQDGNDATQNGSCGNESDSDMATSPVFKRSKHLGHSIDGGRLNATKSSGRVFDGSESSARQLSRHQTHEKINLERKYPTSPKSDDGRRGCIHSGQRIHSKRPHTSSVDGNGTSRESHHRSERLHQRDAESNHRARKREERRKQNNDSHEDLSGVSSSSSSARGDETRPTSSPRYNKFLVKNQNGSKLTLHRVKDLPSRSSGEEHDSRIPSSSQDRKHKRHKKEKSRKHNVSSPTERGSSSVQAGERSSGCTIYESNTQFKKSHRSRRERDKWHSSERSRSPPPSNNHASEGRRRSHRSRHKSSSSSQVVVTDCRFASGTSEVSLGQDNSATSHYNSRGYDMAGIGTPRCNSEEFYVHDITSPDIFSDGEGFIEEVDVVTSSSSRSHRRRGSSRGNRQSVTEIVDDDDDVVILDEEATRYSTPPQADRRRREGTLSGEVFPDGGDITPRTAAAISQLEADEAMARRLQLEFDREEANVRTPPEPEDLGMTESFSPGEGQFARRLVHSFIPELYSSVITFDMGQGMIPMIQSVLETRTPRRGGNQRGRGNRRRRHHVHIEHLYHQTEDDYERLLELEEQLGPAVSQGLPPEILTQLPTFKFLQESKAKAKDDEKSCTICMADYQVNEILRRLPCFHAYHRDCIDRWFENNSACPICRVRVELG